MRSRHAIHVAAHTLRAGTLAVTLSCGLLSHCADPPTQPTVRVRITGIRTAVGTLPFDASSYSIELALHEPTDGPADAGLVASRAIYWDHSDPFEFVVQLPAGEYGPASVQVRTLFECVAGTAVREVVLGSASATAGFTVRAGEVTVAPTLAIVPNPSYCR
ncbi:MAG: hypothetical protein WCJ30_21275 [Deltaproteobacteria bacterium]